MMKIKRVALIALFAIVTIFSVDMADDGTGTLKFTFNSKDPVTGVITSVGSAFTYLHDATKPPPMEKFFAKADQILWGSYGTGLYIIPNIPEGTYYIRIN